MIIGIYFNILLSVSPLSLISGLSLTFAVGNIPYEATEEQLKEIFNQAGTVVSFR